MKIEKLIEELEKIKASEGNIECVIEADDLFGHRIESTIETVQICWFNGESAVRLYWQMF